MILRSDYIDGLIAEYEAEKRTRGKQKWDGNPVNLWMRMGCPAKMTLHVGGKTIILIDGSLTPDFVPVSGTKQRAENAPSVTSGYTRMDLSHLALYCPICNRELKPKQRYCSPRCRQAAKRMRAKGVDASMAPRVRHPKWTQAELQELGPDLRKYIEDRIQAGQ